jgi:hypothetical protein
MSQDVHQINTFSDQKQGPGAKAKKGPSYYWVDNAVTKSTQILRKLGLRHRVSKPEQAFDEYETDVNSPESLLKLTHMLACEQRLAFG